MWHDTIAPQKHGSEYKQQGTLEIWVWSGIDHLHSGQSRTGLGPDPLQRWSLSNMFWLVPWASDQWSETPVQTCYPQICICETKKNTHSQTQVGLNMNSYWQQIFVQIIHKSGPWASVNISGPYNMTQLFKSFMDVQCTLIPSKHMIISYYK